MKFSIEGIVGIDIDPNYRWTDTLFFNNEVASKDVSDYDSCKSYIKIVYTRALLTDDCREITDGLFIGENTIVDKKLGCRIERNDNGYNFIVTQECNEWLIVCCQLLLLENGYTFVHAAGLEKCGNTLLLPSWGGVGKTATVVKMVREENWRLLGDDLIIIDTNGNAIPFLKPFVIYGYHQPLFPELFMRRKGIIRNSFISDWLRKCIPTIKRVLRTVPNLLAYARKHNPHSMRINPSEIFAREQLSTGGKIDRVIWLERLPENNGAVDISDKEIISKIASVTILELFSDRISAINIMCGCAMLRYEDLYIKMYDIISRALRGVKSTQLTIPTSVSIKDVGMTVCEYIKNENTGIE